MLPNLFWYSWASFRRELSQPRAKGNSVSTIEQYNRSFIDTFSVQVEMLHDLKYQDVPDWDSVGHMSLMSSLEDEFKIEMDIDDIIDFSSYETGKAILRKYGVEL
jgi:acyl carrier protein